MAIQNIINSLLVSTQIPLDTKLYSKTLSKLQSLGDFNYKAFLYYEDMVVQCVENHTEYIWREEINVGETNGLLNNSFTYPPNSISNGIDYSAKVFNFFINTKPILEIEGLEQTFIDLETTRQSDLTTANNKRIEENNKISGTNEIDLSVLTTNIKTNLILAINENKAKTDFNESAINNLETTTNALSSGIGYTIPQTGNTANNEPSPTINGIFRADAGTYVNWGGIVVPTTSGFIYDIQVSGIGTAPVYTLKTTSISETKDATPTIGSVKAVESQGVLNSFNEAKLAGDKADAFKCFQKYGDLTNLYTQLGGVNKVEFYKAFEVLELAGFDKTKPHRFYVFWVNGYGTSQYYRFIIQEFDGTDWVNVLDTSSGTSGHFTTTSLGVEAGKLTVFEFEKNGKKMYAEIDYDNLPAWQGALDSSTNTTLIINKSCFKETLPIIEPPLVENDLTKVNGTNISEMNVLTSKDDLEDGVFNGWLDNSYIPNNTIDGAPGQWRTYKLNCTTYQGQNLTFGTTNSSFRKWVFYSGTQLTTGDYGLNVAETVTVPNNATHLYIMLRRYEATESYTNFRINVGDTLLDYEAYIELIESIKGIPLKSHTNTLQKQINNIKEDVYGGISSIGKSTQMYPKTDLPTFNFQFDWGGAGSTANDLSAANLFEENGVRCGFAIGGSVFTDQEVIDKYLEYQKRGHSILNHAGGLPFTLGNFPTTQDAFNQIMIYQVPLWKQGFVINGFVASGSQYDPSLIEAVEKSFAYGATYADSAYNGRTASPCATTRISLENITRAYVKKQILLNITLDKCTSFYGHTYNYGITGLGGIPLITFTVVSTSITAGNGTIEVQGSLPINEGVYSGDINKNSGSGDSVISFSNVTIDSNYTRNTLTVSGLNVVPSVGDTYTYQANDVWNINKIDDILQFVLLQESEMKCKVLSPDDAYKYFFRL